MRFDEAGILAYIDRELPEDAWRKYDALMLSSPAFREKVERMRGVCKLSDDLKKQKMVDTEKAWLYLSRKIAFVARRRKLWDITRTAAAILLPLFLLHQYVIQPALRRIPSEMVTLVSAPGIVTKAMLPDGSEVWLNTQSELSYPVHFTGKERTVQVLGEAYFKVSADKKNRFNVEIPGNITVSAYGTEFNVHAYHDEPGYQVTLAKGNLEIETTRPMKKEELRVGQKAVIDSRTGRINDVVQTDTYAETAWKDGKMVFRREKLESIAHKLSRKFGVVIRLEGDALKEYEYTATFTNETLEDILELLKRSSPITYSMSKREQLDNGSFTQQIIEIKKR